jgi:hypothetical protein
MKSATRNLHVPLPALVHERLKVHSNPTVCRQTRLARAAIEDWLDEAQRTAIAEELVLLHQGSWGQHR